MDAAEFVRSSFEGPMPEPLPWQKAFYEGKPRRMVVGGGRPLGRCMFAVAMLAEALRTGETVRVHAVSADEAEKLMVEARRLLEAKG